MRRNNFSRIFKFAVAAAVGVAILAVLGELVALLWNWLVPDLFGGHTIGYWQALGILLLSKILFGGFPRRFFAGSRMTPEQREKFREAIQRRGKFGSADTAQQQPV